MKLTEARLKKFLQIQKQIVDQINTAAEQYFYVKHYRLPDVVTILEYGEDKINVEYKVNYSSPGVCSGEDYY